MQRRIVVIGASAGGVEALRNLVSHLPADFGAPIVVVLHVSAAGPSVLPQILSRAGPLTAAHVKDDDEMKAGRIYVAPPDHHVHVDRDRLRLSRGPRENRHRPAIDPLFRTAALTQGTAVIAVVLSGALDDGTAGAAQVTSRGGALLVQDPDEATNPSMPSNAIRHAHPTAVLPVTGIAAELVRLVSQPRESPATESTDDEHDEHDAHDAQGRSDRGPGQEGPTVASNREDEVPGAVDERGEELVDAICPDCGGNLWERDVGGTLRYRCRVGHAFSLESLLDGQDDGVETALWSALHALQERADLARRLARRMGDLPRSSARYRERAEQSEQRAELLRRVMASLSLDTAGDGTDVHDAEEAGV